MEISKKGTIFRKKGTIFEKRFLKKAPIEKRFCSMGAFFQNSAFFSKKSQKNAKKTQNFFKKKKNRQKTQKSAKNDPFLRFFLKISGLPFLIV